MVKIVGIYGIALAMLAGGWYAGREVQQVASVSDIALQTLPRQFGTWHATEAGFPEGKQSVETAVYSMTLSDDRQHTVGVILGVTRTRLGSLRDYALASMGQGWVLGAETPVSLPQAQGLPFRMKASGRWSVNGAAARVAISWFVSPRGQAARFMDAELMGWQDRLMGRSSPWGEMYAVTSSHGSDQDLWTAVQDVTVLLGPAFYRVLESAEKR